MKRRPVSWVPAAFAGLFAGGGVAWLYMQQGAGRSVGTLLADLVGLVSTIPLSAQQGDQVQLIGDEFTSAGLGFLSAAAITNAYAESRLDPAALGDNGASVGLFQLHEDGAGNGFSLEERLNPTTNARLIIAEANNRGAEAMRGQTNRALVRWFAAEVERCAACGHQSGTSELDAREELMASLFGAARLEEVPV